MISADSADIRRHVALIWRPGDVFELRALAKERGRPVVTFGFFDDPAAFVRAAAERSGQADGVYATLNPVSPALLARAGKNQLHRAGSGDTTSDRDVLVRRHLLVDFDAIRPAGISSTDEEHQAAIVVARRVREDLAAIGFSAPILASSGNGGHLVYAVEDVDSSVIKRTLDELGKRYSDATIKIDGTVYNPSRISKVYGTLTRKGVSTPDRPHRIARILEAPDVLVPVEATTLERFAPVETQRTSSPSSPSPRPPTSRPRPGGAAPFDLDAWIAEFCPDVKEKPWASGRMWIFPVCPFNDQHDRGEAFVSQGHDGRPSAGCQHESCFKSWRELRERFEPDAYQRPARPGPGGAVGPGGKTSAFEARRAPRQTSPRLTELGNAERFAALHGDAFRYVHAHRQWLTWDGKRWRPSDCGEQMIAAKGVVGELYAEAASLTQRAGGALNSDGSTSEASAKLGGRASAVLDHARRSSKAGAIEAMLKLAQSEDPIAARPGDFDRDPYVFNVANGTLDLRTLVLGPHRQEDMITKIAPVAYDPAAAAPRWETFIERVLPDPELRAWVQRFLGYALTGNVSEQAIAFCYGSGANGKSVLLDTVASIMGSYAITAAPDLLLARQGEAHPTQEADLDGARLVLCSEIDEGRAWNESLIKRITGDRTIRARRMGKDFYEFRATHKLIVAANTRPRVRGADNGIWRRMNLIPFGVTIPPEERIKDLDQALIAEEAAGILAWLVRGFTAWQSSGLGTSTAIVEATSEYRASQDTVGLWIAEECVLVPSAFVPMGRLYGSYTAWCSETGHTPFSRDALRARLLERPGITARRTKTDRGLDGIGLAHRGMECVTP